jgi:prepilin-type N-terminal cleavage/methylation domain-containing protein
MASRKQHGFSLLELMITVVLILIMTAVTFITLLPTFNRAHLENSYSTTLMALRDTRNLAITQSHEYYVVFNPVGFPVGTILIQYQPPPPIVGGILPPLQQVITYSISPDITFAVRGGLPAATPDGFGAGIVPIDFGQGLGAGNLNYVVFMPDGSSRDNLGNYNSGIVYLTRASDAIYSSRAITVWGATGRVRGWRLDQKAGAPIWDQE